MHETGLKIDHYFLYSHYYEALVTFIRTLPGEQAVDRNRYLLLSHTQTPKISVLGRKPSKLAKNTFFEVKMQR